MPGIAGIVAADDQEKLSSWIAAMLHAMTHRPDGDTATHIDLASGYAIGSSSLGIVGPKQQPLRSCDGSFRMVLAGEIYTEEDKGLSAYAPLVDACQNLSHNVLRGINGDFAAAGYDGKRKRLILVSDKFGLQPLYYGSFAGGFAFASEVKSLLALNKFSRNRDNMAFSDIFHYGYILGNRTLFADIHLLPAASILVYDVAADSIHVEPYWSLLEIMGEQNSRDRNGLSETVEAFVSAVSLRTANHDQVGISLSGGLDSRAILAALGDKRRGIHSITVGLPDCYDEYIASQLVAVCDLKHTFLEISASDLDDFHALANTLVFHSDGMWHPNESTEKRVFDYLRASPFRIVLRGHRGEIAKVSLAHPVEATSAMCTERDADGTLAYIYNRANKEISDNTTANLFSDSFQAGIGGAAFNSLTEALLPAGRMLVDADLCLYFYITQYVRRQVTASLSIFKSQAEIRLPYLDEGFLRNLLALPPHKRFSGEVQIEIIKRCMPEFLKIVNSNTGTSLDAGRIESFIREKAYAVSRRLGLARYRQYSEFQNWYREQFRTDLEEFILSPRCLDRGIYNARGLRQIVESHMSGKKQNGRLLATVVGLEKWHRLFVD